MGARRRSARTVTSSPEALAGRARGREQMAQIRAEIEAGLASLAARGVPQGMLFVDATNDAAVSLYASLGFTTHRTDRAYTVEITTDNDTRSTTP